MIVVFRVRSDRDDYADNDEKHEDQSPPCIVGIAFLNVGDD